MLKLSASVPTRALEDVPLVTKSILGDFDLGSNNFIENFQHLPRVSSGAYDFHAGEYINISSRVNTASDNEHEPAEAQHVIYHGATSAKNTGNRIRGHINCLSRTISENEATFKAMNRTFPYHYRVGCQPDPVDGPTYRCYWNFRSLGHITEDDPSKTIWPWLRELVNQILFNMLPPDDSTFRCPWYTDDIKTLVTEIRGEIEAMFGSLPDMSSMSLNRGCCLREPPRLGRKNHHGKCVSCPRIFTPGSFHGQKGVPWEAIFRLFEPGNPFGGVICGGCSENNCPEGHKLCRSCFRYQLLEAFNGRKRCRACAKKNRAYKRRAKKQADNHEEPGNQQLEWSSGDESKYQGYRQFTEREDKILKDGMAANLHLHQIAAVNSYSLLPQSVLTNLIYRNSQTGGATLFVTA